MRKRLCLVATSDLTVRVFLLDHLNALAETFDVTVVTTMSEKKWLERLDPRVRTVHLPMERNPSLLRDFSSLLRLYWHLSSEHYDIVHSFTPKAGFLVALAAAAGGCKTKVHTFTGQVWTTHRGLRREGLKWVDRIIAVTSTAILTDSKSQSEMLRAAGVVHEVETAVLGKGCFTGVSLGQFNRSSGERARIREELGVEDGESVVVFVGRLKRDKGILDLARAVANVSRSGRRVHLVVCGPDEEHLGEEIEREGLVLGGGLHLVGFSDSPERWMRAGDVLCLPSYREGFGSVIVEAGAAGIPAIGSRIPGIVDAIEDGATGLLHDPGDVDGLTKCLVQLIEDKALCVRLGENAERRAVEHFSREASIRNWLDFYAALPG